MRPAARTTPGGRRRGAHDQQPLLQAGDSRSGDGYSALEPQIESLVRQHIKRGTVQVSLRVDRARASDDFQINTAVLGGYRQQLRIALGSHWNASSPERPSKALLQLPGVVNERRGRHQRRGRRLAAGQRDARKRRMANMAPCEPKRAGRWRAIWPTNCRIIAQGVGSDRARAPLVSDFYRRRLTERLTKTLAEFQITLAAGRSDPRSQHLRRAERHLRRDRAAAEPSGAVRRYARRWKKAPAASSSF